MGFSIAGKKLVEVCDDRFSRRAFVVEPECAGRSQEEVSVVLTFTHPVRTTERVQIIERDGGHTFEVTFSDGSPPGPAERQFIFQGLDDLEEAIAEMMDFVDDIFAGRVVAYREAIGPIASWLRRDSSRSLLWFTSREEPDAERRLRRAVAVYDWRAGQRTSG